MWNVSKSRGCRGSSPLTRGKRTGCGLTLGCSGLIPAHAGKTRARARGLGCWWAHPRSRGENGLAATSCSRVLDSSPLTRGKLARTQTGTTLTRITPAHAGKTSIHRRLRRTSRAHPRLRGENCVLRIRLRCSLGSSPLTRGKLTTNPVNTHVRGLIPAHARKT